MFGDFDLRNDIRSDVHGRTPEVDLWTSVGSPSVGATAPPLPKGETTGTLTISAYASATAPPIKLGAVAAGATGMLSGALEVKEVLSGGADAAVAEALQLVESVGMKLASGVLDAVVASVTAALPAAASVVADVSGAVPIVGAAVSVVAGVIGFVNAQVAADIDAAQRFNVALWRGIEGSFQGGKVVPADYFWNSHGDGSGSTDDRLGMTSVGRLLFALTEARPEHFAKAVDLLRSGYGYPHQDDVAKKARDLWAAFDGRDYYYKGDQKVTTGHKVYPISQAEQAYLKKLGTAIMAMSARYETDGGFALWPAYIDVLYSIRSRNPALFDLFLDAVRELDHMTSEDPNSLLTVGSFSASYGGAWMYDARSQNGVQALIDDWQQTVDFARVRKLEALPSAMRGIVRAVGGKPMRGRLPIGPLPRPTSGKKIALVGLGAAALIAKLFGLW